MTTRPNGKSWLELIERGIILTAQVAIPFTIAITGVLIQRSVATMHVQQQYVEVAVDLLTRADDEVDRGLRVWAVDVLQAHAPIPLDPETERRLKTGEIVLPWWTSCTNECGYVGQIVWLDEDHYMICQSSGPCLVWSDPIYSPQGRPPTETP